MLGREQHDGMWCRGGTEVSTFISPAQGGAPGGVQVAPSPRKPISPDPMGKPPASPASREITAAGDTECVFLIGAYQRSRFCPPRAAPWRAPLRASCNHSNLEFGQGQVGCGTDSRCGMCEQV